MMKGGPHSHAATIFANWFASKEGQEVLSTSVLQPSRRADVQVKDVLEYAIFQAGLKYLDTYESDFIVNKRQEVTKRFMEIIGR
jgi:ABC-type Fe3+ transport system substrate-binding protein